MGEASITESNWRLVEVGRVILLQGDSPYAGRLAAIVEIIDHKRPFQGSHHLPSRRRPPRGARTPTVQKFWEKNEIDSKWEQTNWAKRRQQIQRRQALTDFDRFKVMRLKKQRRFEERRVLAKIRAKA
ncbi:unnamed protein product [Parascedosporium putredinis]|uniref:Large ribosomal subunit protein eL14 domain-containing protein n=1 Tax=Parascedosporium putredinis TaxID=1442378 RepID=A0A9P1H9U7_9PEZI|nr:unnamed protein product [Parascedosporium putredinis]CAI8001353.1 unnamed protein product [Parascedosporium putredinis]